MSIAKKLILIYLYAYFTFHINILSTFTIYKSKFYESGYNYVKHFLK